MLDQFWVETEGSQWRLGLRAEFVETIEGDWVALDLPAIGDVLRAEEAFGFLSTDEAAYDLRAPCPFRVVRVNLNCVRNPEIVRLSPQGEGWLLEIEGPDGQPLL